MENNNTEIGKADSQESPESPDAVHGGGDKLEADKPSERKNKERERLAIHRAKERARIARWDLDVAVFLFVVMIIVIILLFQDISIGIVAPVAVIGLGMVWLTGWRRGQHLYRGFYEEELYKLEKEMAAEEKEKREKNVGKPTEETIEEAVRKAIHDRLR